MKKQNQVRSNGSRRAAVPQSKTTARKGNTSPGRRTAGTVTYVLTLPDGREWARVDFPSKKAALIDQAAAKLGITLPQLFTNAIRAACKRHGILVSLERRAA